MMPAAKYFGLASLVLLAACSSMGPRALPGNHLAFNDAVSMTESRELLLNLVRLRYADPIKFLSVDSMTATFSTSFGVGGDFGQDAGDPTALLSPSFRFADAPTLSFTPQGDAKFVRDLLSPASVSTIALALEMTSDLEFGLRLLVDELGGARDVPGPKGELFRARARKLAKLREEDRVTFCVTQQTQAVGLPMDRATLKHSDILAAAKEGYSYEETPDGKVVLSGTVLVPGLILRNPESAYAEPEFQTLGLEPGQAVVPLRSSVDVGAEGREKGAIYITPRSVLSMMAVLARGVDVPHDHQCAGLVPALDLFPGQGGIGDLIRIHSSPTNPSGRLSVFHRGHWFWISDSDMRSKDAFFTLLTFYGLKLKADASEGARPVLTLPLGR